MVVLLKAKHEHLAHRDVDGITTGLLSRRRSSTVSLCCGIVIYVLGILCGLVLSRFVICNGGSDSAHLAFQLRHTKLSLNETHVSRERRKQDCSQVQAELHAIKKSILHQQILEAEVRKAQISQFKWQQQAIAHQQAYQQTWLHEQSLWQQNWQLQQDKWHKQWQHQQATEAVEQEKQLTSNLEHDLEQHLRIEAPAMPPAPQLPPPTGYGNWLPPQPPQGAGWTMNTPTNELQPHLPTFFPNKMAPGSIESSSRNEEQLDDEKGLLPTLELTPGIGLGETTDPSDRDLGLGLELTTAKPPVGAPV